MCDERGLAWRENAAVRENRGVEADRAWGDGSSGAPASRTMVTAVASLPGRREPSPPFTDDFADAVCRHHGRVVSRGAWLGAAFPTARAAVACVLEVRRRWTAEDRHPVAGLALHAGEVTDAGGELVGEGIVTAAALAAAVAPGDVLCTGPVRELAAGLPGVDFVSHGSLDAYPVDRPVAVFRLAEVAEAAWAPTPLVGRDRERAELRQLLRRALLGRGELVLLTGEAGVGKTYLADDLVAEARAFGAQVLTGRCQQDATLPYLPFVEMLDALLPEMQAPDQARQILAEDAPQLAKIMPRLRALLPDIPAALDLPPDQERRYLFQAVHAFLARLAQIRPLVLVVEDVHWADDATLQLLRHMAERTSEMPALVMATCRDEPAERGERLEGLLEELLRRRLARRMRLEPLSPASVAAMLAALALQDPPPEVVESVWGETDGNPFFVEEVYRHLHEEGKLFDERGRFRHRLTVDVLDVPETVRLTLQRRLDRLGAPTGQVLAAAAVIGRDFPVRLLDGLREVSPDELADALERAERAGLVRPSPGDTLHFTFTHELVRQTLLAGIPTLRRQRLHARVADAMEQLVRHPEEHAAEIAYHLGEAGDAADPRVAVRFLALAGDRAVAGAAYAEALQAYERALAYPEGDLRTTGALLFGRGVARHGVGEWQGAVDDWHAAVSTYERVGDADGVAAVALRIVLRMSASGRVVEGLEMAARALCALGGGAHPARVRLLAVTAKIRSLACDYPAAEAALAEAFPDAEVLGDRPLLGEVLTYQGFVHWTHMEVAAGVETTGQGLALLDPAEGVFAHSEAMWELLGCSLLAGRLGDVAQRLGELDAAAARSGNPIALYAAPLYRALLAAAAGDLDAMESWAEETLGFCERAGLPWGSVAHGYLGWAALWRGRWDDMRKYFEEAARREPPGFFRGADPAGLALSLAYCGEPEEALTVIDQLEQDGKLPRSGVRNPLASWSALLSTVEALVVSGERKRAGSLHPVLVEGIATGAVLDLWCGRLLERVAGLAAAAGGRWEEAQQHYERALRQAGELPHRVEMAEARRCYAAMLLERARPGDQERGRRLAQEAIQQYAALGMTGRAGLTQQLVASGGGRPAPAPDGGTAEPSRRNSLRREGEVWTVHYADQVVRVRDAKGFHYLARLLREPGREFHVLDLGYEGGEPGAAVPAPAWNETQGRGFGDAGALLDPKAKAAYRQRMEELNEELDEAVLFSDPERAARAEEELEALKAELARAVGLGGRDRPAASSAEKARLNVTRAIRSAVQRLAGANPQLGDHLRLTVRTGTFCSYQPDPAAPTVWDV
jgi:tetratricopeptide (TPR) repeat protein